MTTFIITEQFFYYLDFSHSILEALKSQSYLTLLGCVSPYQNDYGETLSTIQFVSETKLLKRTPQMNALIRDFQVRK